MEALIIIPCAGFMALVLLAMIGQIKVDEPESMLECVVAKGECIYIAEGRKGLCVYQVDNNGRTLIASDYQGEPAYDVCTDGKYIYVANGRQGVCQYIFDGECLTYIDWLTPGEMITGVSVRDGHIVGTTREGKQYKYTANADGLTPIKWWSK